MKIDPIPIGGWEEPLGLDADFSVSGPFFRGLEGIMDKETIAAIENVLAKGDRVELIPTKDGTRVIHIKRKQVHKATRPAGTERD